MTNPAARARITALQMDWALPLQASAAMQLGNLRDLEISKYVAVRMVRALQALPYQTSLTVAGLMPLQPRETPLQPADLPPALQLWSIRTLVLYDLWGWLPALIAVSNTRGS
jgi:hypothetical protein